MNSNNENINKLLEKFFDQQSAEKIEKDMQYAQMLFQSRKCPSPNPQLIKQIKAELNSKIQKKKRFTLIRNITAAAACLLLIILGYFIFSTVSSTQKNNTHQIAINNSFWGETEKTDNNTETADLYARLEDIETNLMNIRLDEADDYHEDLQIINLEMEVIEEDDFWKG